MFFIIVGFLINKINQKLNPNIYSFLEPSEEKENR